MKTIVGIEISFQKDKIRSINHCFIYKYCVIYLPVIVGTQLKYLIDYSFERAAKYILTKKQYVI